MARIIYSALVESIRGSIAGTTFQRNAHGYSVKKKPAIVNPNTPLQSRQKKYFSIAARSWRDMTQTERDNFITYSATYPQYAKNNPSSVLSAYSVFVKWNALILLSGYPVRTAPSFTNPDTDTWTLSLQLNAGALEAVFTSVTNNEDWLLLLFFSRPFSAAENFVGSKTRFIIDGTNVNQTIDISDEYLSIYGTLPSVGDRIAAEILAIGDDAPKILSRQTAILTVS